MAITKITVALDVDGVLCPVVHPDDPRHERETGWSFTTLPDTLYGMVAADPVLNTLRELAESPDVDVLWHTSWWIDAPEALAPALRLPALTGSIERLFATCDEFRGTRRQEDWWKLVAVERWLREHPVSDNGDHELLIWIDDDINDAIRSGEITAEMLGDPRLVVISPAVFVGINPDELARLRSLTGLD